MATVNSTNLLDFLIDYFISIGCASDEVKEYFSARRFSEGIVLNMPASNLLFDNKPVTNKGKQSHIHVTSRNCEFFIERDVLDKITVSTDWKKLKLRISRANIAALPNSTAGPSLSVVNSFTMIKVECRKTQEKQVQLSKIKEDDPLFIRLREGIFENDVLVFLKYRDSDYLFAAAVPNHFFRYTYTFESAKANFKGEIYISLESSKAIPVKKALESVLADHDSNEVIESEDPISDAIYQCLVDDAEPSSTDYVPVEYTVSSQDDTKASYSRPKTSPSLGKEAIKINDYRCAIDGKHITFVKPDGTRYMEVHHLVPLSRQGDFKYKLDTKANIVPLCPNCHRMLHHGRLKDIEPVLELLFTERKDKLKRSGIDITCEALVDCYR